MSADALSQFVATCKRIDQHGPRTNAHDHAMQYMDAANQLTIDEAWACARQQQLWLASFPAEDSAAFIDTLVELTSLYRSPNPPTLQSIYKAAGPEEARGRGAASMAAPTARLLDDDDDDLDGGERFECATWLDKAGDEITREHMPGEREAMEIFLFKTMALILLNMKSLGGLPRVSPPAVSFFFSSIEQGSAHATQRCATFCCGVISSAQLPVLLDRFSEKSNPKNVPEKRFRWLVRRLLTRVQPGALPHSAAPPVQPTHPFGWRSRAPSPLRGFGVMLTALPAGDPMLRIRCVDARPGRGDGGLPRASGQEDGQDRPRQVARRHLHLPLPHLWLDHGQRRRGAGNAHRGGEGGSRHMPSFQLPRSPPPLPPHSRLTTYVARACAAQVYWTAFRSRFQMLSKRYADAFAAIYTTVAKWAKKAKHALPCWQLMARMTCLGNTEFYLAHSRKSDAILPTLLKSISTSKALRSECYQFVLEYLRELPIELCRTDMEGFVPEAKKLLALSFPKKKEADFTDDASLIAAVNSIGRLNANFCFAELQTMLPSKDTTTTQKSLLCHALGTLAKDNPREVYNYNATLGPLMLLYMESEYEPLAVYAIRSFPHVTVPDPQQEKAIVRKVAFVAVTAEHDVAETAFGSLAAYCMARPDVMLPPLASILLTEISNRPFSRGDLPNYSAVNAGFGYLHRLILIYLGHLEQSAKPSAINAMDWIQVREQAEGVACMWLVHTDASVRAAAMEALRVFSHPVFVTLEDHRVGGIVRLHSVLPPADDSYTGVWSPHMARLLALTPPPPGEPGGLPIDVSDPKLADTGRGKMGAPHGDDGQGVLFSERFRYALEYAWVRLVNRFFGGLEVLPSLEPEKVGLWLSYAKFLCLAVPYPVDAGMYGQGMEAEQIAERVMPTALEEFWASLLRVAWAEGLPPGIRSALLSYVEQIHATCIPHAVRVVKALRDAPPPEVAQRRRGLLRKKKVAKGEKEEDDGLAASGWIFHEEVLELIARFCTRLTTNHRAAAAKLHELAQQVGADKSALTQRFMGATGMGTGQGPGDGALPAALVQTLQYCVAAWIQDFERFGPETCRRLGNGVRYSGMRMVKVYLDPASGAMGGYVDVPPASRMLQWLLAWAPPPRRVYVEAAYRHIPEFVGQLMVEAEQMEDAAYAASGYQAPRDGAVSEADERLHQNLEVAVVEALEAMLNLGPLTSGGGEAAQRVALHFLQMMALRGPHLRRPVEKALSAFLRFNPMFVGHFFKLSVVEYCEDQLGLNISAAELLASMQLRGLVRCWCEDLGEWISRHGVPIQRMVLVSLLHQCSSDADSRASAIELATALARNPTEPLDAGSALPATEFVTLSSCVASTYRYSQVLAVQYSTRMGEPLLRELVATARLLPDVQNESMLHMILPWIAHFGIDFADEMVGEWKDVWWAFLSHLLQLSHQCHERANSSFLFFTLEACWTAVLQGKQSMALIELTMEFLIGTHAEATARAQRAQAATGVRDDVSLSGAPAAADPAADPRSDASAATLIQHLCMRIVLFIGQSGRAPQMLAHLINSLPRYGEEGAPAGAANAQAVLDMLSSKAHGAETALTTMQAAMGSVREPSTFLLASELLLAHIEQLASRVPLILHMALVHFGPQSATPIGGEFIRKLLAKLTNLSKEERKPIEHPPADAAGREKLVAALCEDAGHADAGNGHADNALSLREGWAAVALTWAMSVPEEASASQALEWFEVLTRHRSLAYGECHQLVGLIACSLEAGRHIVAMAALRALRDHTARIEALPYVNGVLLCVAAVLSINAARLEMFSLAQSLLRATLDRSPAGATAELTNMQLVLRPPPPPPSNDPWRSIATEQERVMAAYDPNPSWKSRLLQEALDAQLGLWDLKGTPLSADELLRMLLLRGGSLRSAQEDTMWLLSELKAIYQPHLPNIDEMGIAHVWLMLLQVCTAPRTPKADLVCEQAVAWLTARGGHLTALRGAFEELHSSSQRAPGAAYAWAQTGKKGDGEDADWWHQTLARYLSGVKGLCPSNEEQRRAFSVMLEACCLWLMIEEPIEEVAELSKGVSVVSNAAEAAELAFEQAAAAAAAAAAHEAAKSAASAQRWAALCMLGALLSEFRGPWSQQQHEATSQLLSSLVFSLSDARHAAKLRKDMQFLVADPPAGQTSSLHFVQRVAESADAAVAPAQRRPVGVAAEAQIAIAEGRFANHLHLRLLSEDDWLAALRMLFLKLPPTDEMASLSQRLSAVHVAPPSLPPLPAARLTNMAFAGQAPAAAPPAGSAPPPPPQSGAPGAQPPAEPPTFRGRGLSQASVLPPPDVPGVRQSRSESISAFLPPPPPLPALPKPGAPMLPQAGVGGLTREASASVVLPPPPIPGMPPAGVSIPGMTAARPPPTIGGGAPPMPGGMPPPPAIPAIPGLPSMTAARTNFVVPPPPVLGSGRAAGATLGGRESLAARPGMPPPPPMLTTGTAGGAGRVSAAQPGSGQLPPPPMLASGANGRQASLSVIGRQASSSVIGAPPPPMLGGGMGMGGGVPPPPAAPLPPTVADPNYASSDFERTSFKMERKMTSELI